METGQEQVCVAIRQLRAQVRWKPGKAVTHLSKRIALGHLRLGTQLVEYEALVLHVVSKECGL